MDIYLYFHVITVLAWQRNNSVVDIAHMHVISHLSALLIGAHTSGELQLVNLSVKTVGWKRVKGELKKLDCQQR